MEVCVSDDVGDGLEVALSLVDPEALLEVLVCEVLEDGSEVAVCEVLEVGSDVVVVVSDWVDVVDAEVELEEDVVVDVEELVVVDEVDAEVDVDPWLVVVVEDD